MSIETTQTPRSELSRPSPDMGRDVFHDGQLLCHLRFIRPDDADKLIAFHAHLAPRSIYLRFFTFHPTLSAVEVEKFTSVDNLNRLALVAEADETLIAVGRFDSKAGDTEAEVAFVVADACQHHGIGALLLDELVTAARMRGIVTFRAETLCENHTMLDVFRHSGFVLTTSIDCGTVTLRFPIQPTAQYEEALAERELSRLGQPVPAGPTMTEEVP